MFNIQATKKMVEHAIDQVEKYNFGKRPNEYDNGNKEQQITGMIGQTAVHDLFGFTWPTGAGGCDGGKDFNYCGVIVDVKTMGRNCEPRPHYANNFLACQIKLRTDMLIFCSLNKQNNVISVCGWLPKKELKDKAIFQTRGDIIKRDDGTSRPLKADNYEILNSEINNVDTFASLKVQLMTVIS